MLNHLGIILFIATVAALVALGWRETHKTESHHAILPRIIAEADSFPEEAEVSLWMRVLVSVVILGAALYIILSQRFQGDQQKWAFGAVGTVLGFWLKG